MLGALLLADMGWGNHMNGWGAGWWILMAFLMVVFWGLVIFGIVWLVRSLAAAPHGHDAGTPMEVLERRLANGEISPAEYRERRETLSGRKAGDGSP